METFFLFDVFVKIFVLILENCLGAINLFFLNKLRCKYIQC